MKHYESMIHKLHNETQETFIKTSKKLFVSERDKPKIKEIEELQVRLIDSRTKQVKSILYGLDIFDSLGIVKHEIRRQLLINLKSQLEKDSTPRIYDMIHMVKMYPDKIKSPLFESLLELAISKTLNIIVQNKVEFSLVLYLQLSKK